MNARRAPTPSRKMDAAGAVFMMGYARVHVAARGRQLWPCERAHGERIWRAAVVWARGVVRVVALHDRTMTP